MHTQPGQANVTELAKRRKAVGRQGTDKQEAVIKLSQVKDKIDYLVGLHRTAETASKDLHDGIKAIAEKAGLLSSVVKRYVSAKAGDRFEDKVREVQQLSLLFDVTDQSKPDADEKKAEPKSAQDAFVATQAH